MAKSTTELIVRFSGDPRHLKATLADIRKDLSQSGQVFTKTWKGESLERIQQTRQAQVEIRRMERERQQIVQQNSRAIAAAAKFEADAKIREGKRAANEAIRLLREEAAERRRAAGVAGGSSLLIGAAGGLTALIGLNVVSEIRQAGAAWLDYSSKLETTRIAFATMLGSAEAADAHLKELQRFALTTPFQFIELIDASQRMQALGFRAEQIVPILTDVGNAVAAAGGGSERLDRVVLALSQMQSKGKVATQELNQLAEAGIGGFKILEQSLGKSRAELVGMVEAGKISSKVFLDAFQEFSKINFGGLMEQQSRTFAGAMSNIKDALLAVSASAFDPLFKKISEITDSVAQELQKGQPTIESVARSIVGGLIEIIGTAGAQAGAAFIQSTASKIGDASAWKQLLRNVSGVSILEPAFRGLFSVDPEDFFGIGDVSLPQIKIPDLTVPLRAQTEAQKEVSESAKKAGEIVKDLTLKLAFYGNETERAATLQKLFALGVEAVTSAEGRRAIQLAALIDAQRLSGEIAQQQERITRDLALVTETKYKTAFESLSQVHRDVSIGLLEIQRASTGGLTALERFNFGVGAQVKGMLESAQASAFSADQVDLLTNALKSAQIAMAGLTKAQEQARERDLTKKALESLEQFRTRQIDTFRELRLGQKTALQEAEEFIKLFSEDLGKALTGAQITSESFWLRFNAHLTDSARRMERMIELMHEMADVVPAPGGAVPESPFVPIELGPPPEISIWQEAMIELRKQMVEFSDFIRSTFISSIFDISAALAQGVATWALYGGSFAKAMKQALAALGAKIAAEAIMMAAIHAAYAIGSAAFGNFAAAAKHALAAAKFAAIGGVAALATRALAGNEFNQSGSQGGGRIGTSGDSRTSVQPRPVEFDRRSSQPATHDVIEIRFTGKLGDVIEANWIDRYNGGGRLRRLVRTDRDA